MTGIFQLWNINFQVPFNYRGDTLWFLSLIKGMVDNGWLYIIPQLSAPFSFNAAGFPSMTNLDWGIMKLISLFLDDPGAVLNVFWLISFVLTAWAAMLALRLLGITDWLALWLGLIYSFMPYAFFRNTAHISLVYYCVPLLSCFAIVLACGDKRHQSSSILAVGYLSAIAQGFNYIYYSFFSVLLFLFSGWLGYKKNNSLKSLRIAAVAISIITVSSLLNLLPSYRSWQEYGKPPSMDFKTPEQAEIYALKLRKMLAPHEKNIVPVFNQWGRRDLSIPFPNENENSAARLGPFAAFGFLFILAILLGIIRSNNNEEGNTIKSIAAIALFSFLVTTVGGFGAIINEVIGSDIRCYNRFSVFIGFFSIAGFGLWLQEKIKAISNNRVHLIALSLVAVLICFSLYDQLLDSIKLNSLRQQDEQIAYSEKQFVKALEAKLPFQTSIFQLPTTVFPENVRERMYLYDHARPYVWSSHLRWSWPSFSQRHRNWQHQIDTLEGKELIEALILSNFRVIWVDRFGYADNGAQTISSLIAAGANDILPNAHSRYVALDLEPVAIQLRERLSQKEFTEQQAMLLETPIIVIDWISGVYPVEYSLDAGKKFRWSQAESVIQINNPTTMLKSVILSFLTGSGSEGYLTVTAGSQQIKVPVTGIPTRVNFPLTLKPNTIQKVQFKGDMGRMPLPTGETRDLHFYLMDVHLQEDSLEIRKQM